MIHKNLTKDSWKKIPFIEQMSHVGSEIFRAIKWKRKDNIEYSQKAYIRGLELLGLTISVQRGFYRICELTRLREVLNDYFYGNNIFNSTGSSLEKYFYQFNFAARK